MNFQYSKKRFFYKSEKCGGIKRMRLSFCLSFFLTLVPRNNLFAGKKEPTDFVWAFGQNGVNFVPICASLFCLKTKEKQQSLRGIRERVQILWDERAGEKSQTSVIFSQRWGIQAASEMPTSMRLTWSLSERTSSAGEGPGVSHSFFGAHGLFHIGHFKDTPFEKHFFNLGCGFCAKVQVEALALPGLNGMVS